MVECAPRRGGSWGHAGARTETWPAPLVGLLTSGGLRRLRFGWVIGGPEAGLQSLQRAERVRDVLPLLIVSFQLEQLIQPPHGNMFDFSDPVVKLIELDLYQTRVG